MSGDPGLIYPLLGGVLGAVVGSFLNVVIWRLPREELSIGRPARSFCPSCKTQLQWFENVPVISWLFLGGRCRSCKVSIPARYVIVEVVTAFLFGLWALRVTELRPELGLGFGESWDDHLLLIAGLYLISVCVVVTYIDHDFKIIPDEITWPGMALGLVLSAAVPAIHEDAWLYGLLVGELDWNANLAASVSSVSGLLAGVGSVWGVGWLGSVAFRKEAMGLGDVKYLGLVGAFLGLDGVLMVFFLGCVSGALGGLLQRGLTGARYIAFGPYLSLGVILVLLYRGPILDFMLITWPSVVRSVLGID